MPANCRICAGEPRAPESAYMYTELKESCSSSSPSQDVVLGLYYMTRDRINAKGEGMSFADTEEVQRAYGDGM